MKPAAFAVLDKSALRHNLNVVRRYAPGARIMAVIKANGYGHGLVRVAKELVDSDAFAVARVDEGVRLRETGIEQRIVVLEGFGCHQELDMLHRFDLEPVIHTEHQLTILEGLSKVNFIHGWLKLDTGMHRLGFDADRASEIVKRLEHCVSVAKPIPLLTHLANADDLDDPTTDQQVECFNRVTAEFSGPRSIANSAGILGWKSSLTDWVRPGIMLFGVSPFAGRSADDYQLIPALTLFSKLLAVKNLKPGDAVGYGGTWVSDKPMKLGVAAIGYGDGYPRHAAVGTPVLVDGCITHLVGRVSMDMITIDLTDCPDVGPGAPVVLWGKGLPVEEIAQHASTIPYTLLCGITQRVLITEDPC